MSGPPFGDMALLDRRKPSTIARVRRLTSIQGRSAALICLLTALCAGAAIILSGSSASLTLVTGSQTTDDAYVRADQIAISSHIAGYVASVPVRDNEIVSEGQVVATIRDDDYKAQLSVAEAELRAAQSSVDILAAQASLQNARVAGAEASLKATEAALTQARLEHARQNALVSKADSPRRNLEVAEAANGRLAADQAQKRADIAASGKMLEVIERKIVQARQTVMAKEAVYNLARINLAYTRIISPVSGQLSTRKVLPGEYVVPGTQVGLVVPLPDVRVVANFRERQIADMRPGQAASITIDSVPGQTFHGTVNSFGPVSGALQALLPPDNATGNFTKVAQSPGRVARDVEVERSSAGVAVRSE